VAEPAVILYQKELSDADLLMATQAAVEGAVLVTSDMALRRIPSVSAKDWNEFGPAMTEG